MAAPSRPLEQPPVPVAASSPGRLLEEYFAELEFLGEPPSNAGPMLARLEARGIARDAHPDPWRTVPTNRRRLDAFEVDERLLEALDRARPVRRALAAIGPRHAEALRVLFGQPRPPGLAVFGDAAALVPRTQAARQAWRLSGTSRCFEEWLVRLAWRAAQRIGETQATDALNVRSIRSEAEQLRQEAVRAFVAALREYRSIRRRRGGCP